MAFLKKNISRRQALRMMGGSAAVTGGAFAFNLAAIGSAAQAQSWSDYKALVCIFQYGGNDQSNTVIPYDSAAFADYQTARPSLARLRDQLLPINPAGYSGPQLALPPELAPLRDLFHAGDLAIQANVGPLVHPVSRAQWEAGQAIVPPQLFSHSDQQNAWMTSWPDVSQSSGWLGRIGDIVTPLSDPNGSISMNMSLAGNNLMQAGNQTVQYQLTPEGAIAMEPKDSLYWSDGAAQRMRQIITGSGYSNLLAQQYASITDRAIRNEELVAAALASQTPLQTQFPESWLGQQLAGAARMIAARQALGQSRQIFFVGTGGYDTHDDLPNDHPPLLSDLAACMAAFHAAMVELGVNNDVTTFTASDFGRALQYNGRGSDHGWGAHHFVMGGSVRGGRVYGGWPDVALNSMDDAGQGRLIPTTSVDEYAAAMAEWFGVPFGALPEVLPNIGRFDRAGTNFML